MRKDIRSDRDILEEEVIKPTKIKSTTNISFNSAIDDLQNTQRYDEPSVQHLIQYKQQIRIENDRRLHREKLAELARNQRKNEQYFQSDFSLKPEENQQQKLDNNIKLSHKPIVKSKEEEEILNDENVFQHKQYRYKERQRNKLPTSHIHGRYITDFPSSMKKSDQNLICKVCGNVINEKDNQPIVYSQQNSGKFIYLFKKKIQIFISAAPTARSYQPQPSSQSVETTTGAVDDWFESALNVSGLRQSTPRSPGDAISPPIGSSTFRRSLFQPINNNNNNDIVEHRPPIRPLIPTDDDGTKTKRTITPRISESGIFTRSPESKIRRPSSSRSTPSPVIKKHQTDIPAVTASSIKERKMSGWSVREHSPDDSD
jgi:rubrerythrin